MINKIIDKCKECKNDKIYLNEMQTKTSLILPLFEYIGYDTTDFNLFKTEYACGNGRVDYAIMGKDKPELLIETKKISENLDQHIEQIERYLNYHKNTQLGVLCNGFEYRFFKKSKNDIKEIWRFDTTELNTTDIKILELIKNKGIDILYDKKIIQPLIINIAIKNLLKNPTDEFAKIIQRLTGLDSITTADIKNDILNITNNISAISDNIIAYNSKNLILSSPTEMKYYNLYRNNNIDFSKEEAIWLAKIKTQFNFDFYKSIKMHINNTYYGKYKDKYLSNFVDKYISNRSHKAQENIVNNKDIFISICKKLISTIGNEPRFIDDFSGNNELVHTRYSLKVASL